MNIICFFYFYFMFCYVLKINTFYFLCNADARGGIFFLCWCIMFYVFNVKFNKNANICLDSKHGGLEKDEKYEEKKNIKHNLCYLYAVDYVQFDLLGCF